MRAFYVICNVASKSFVLQRDVNGRAVRFNLGQSGDISAKSAPDLVEDIYLNKIKQSIDSDRGKREARVQGMTLSLRSGTTSGSPSLMVRSFCWP
jgi:hypothetical protein